MDKFETWWESEGQEFLFALNTTTDDDIKLVAEIAWKNGAYCAEQAEQEPVALIELLREARDNCKASIVEEGISATRKEYRIDLEARLSAALNAAPVRTKDLTDDEIGEIYEKHHALGGCWTDGFAYERAVIAADREKNK